jgi:glucose-6-phosphate dehydrogenase assembly protein OpcA
MTIAYKILGQTNPSGNVDTTAYTVPAGNNTVISTINVCNQATTSANFRIAVRQAGASLTSSQYLVYDSEISSRDTISFTIGVTLGATDVVTVRANSSTLSFNLFGSEIY